MTHFETYDHDVECVAEPIVNWTNDDVLDARNRLVRLRDGSEFRLKLYNGWAVIKELGPMNDPHITDADIWAIRYFLNTYEAKIVPLI